MFSAPKLKLVFLRKLRPSDEELGSMDENSKSKQMFDARPQIAAMRQAELDASSEQPGGAGAGAAHLPAAGMEGGEEDFLLM